MEARAIYEIDRALTIGPDYEVLINGRDVKSFVDGSHFGYKIIVMRNGEGETLEAPYLQVSVMVFKDSYTNP